ncbi:Protein of unknown function, partial [Gryllus bimaculatus]
RGFSFQSDARAQMKFRALCALALAAWACVARERARRRPDGARELLAVPDGDPAAETAPRAPEQCRSGMGHALRLLRHLPREGSFCIGFVPTNGVCNPPMRCFGNFSKATLRAQMKCVALCALALAAWACVGVRAQGDDPERRVSCLPCRDGDPAARNCTAVRPEHYRSGRLTWCGCCDTCLVYIVDGQFCVGAIPTNGVCNPPMQCEGNVCRNS